MSITTSPEPTPRGPPRRVLEDATGRRRQRLRWAGRIVALFFGAWLAVVILGGIGVGPAAHVPFGHVLRPTAGPPPLAHPPRVTQPKPADLVPALPAPTVAVATPSVAPVVTTSRVTHGRSAAAPGHSTTNTTTTLRGKSALAPGHTKATLRKAPIAVPPGQAKTKTRGKKP